LAAAIAAFFIDFNYFAFNFHIDLLLF